MSDNKDSDSNVLTRLTWEPGKLAEPLNTVINLTTNSIETECIDWYRMRRKRYRVMGQWLRGLAIVLVALAGILPQFVEILNKRALKEQFVALQNLAATNTVALSTNMPLILTKPRTCVPDILMDPTWTAILLAIAATLVLFDKFFGSTSGWVRFALTTQQLENLLHEFRLAMEAEKLSWGNLEPNLAQAQVAMRKVQDFGQQVGSIVMEETKAWATEFAEVLKELDQRVQQAAKLQEKGTIQLVVSNGDQCLNGWKVSIDDKPLGEKSGKEAAFDVMPDGHRIAVTGIAGEKRLAAERAVKVAPGEIQKVELTLA